MKVSVIIPVYNVSKYIERCLLSVLNQTWQDLEVILVNDCTPDDSMEVIANVLSEHIRSWVVKIVVHEKNRGIAGARNSGIRYATGDYLYFLDSDDYLTPQGIEQMASVALQYNVDVVAAEYELVGNAHVVTSELRFSGFLENNEKVIRSYAKDQWAVMPWNKLVRHELIKKELLFFEETIVHEDDLWSFKLACCAQSAYGLPEKTYYYVLHANSFMGKTSPKKLQSRVRIIEMVYDYITSSERLRNAPYIYFFYETMKARYFDVIMYNSSDYAFWRHAYQVIRQKKYISAFKALFTMHVSLKMALRNLHYLFPVKAGYWYYAAFVKFSYYLLVLPVKIKQLFFIK
ncbi:glycosyl transferase family 2 [Bacteroides heparinolyticus]|uniref:Glycosyl transferase family 2 n=1 Tax=Prevotella heparinolytica TaxID=28113 RepID=A0A4R2LI04_9BACE|nr:glycosyltransferase [Bacteroides heparinolyticus]TCO89989.1 glycosyl transferase family 2 [Bacteroides heparinolyticus]